jgi:hypothetical protein
LTSPQNEARRSAQAINRMVETIELPYRSWLVGDDAAPPSSLLWDEDMWKVAEADSAADALALRDAGRSGDGWAGVDAWQQKLAAQHGRDPLQRNFVPTGYASASAPAFGLTALGSLFDGRPA